MSAVTHTLREALRGRRPVAAVWWEACAVGRAVRAAWQGPGRERDLIVQSLKAAGAALIAWAVAGVWLDDPMALMAPWVALVLVQATVYSSVRQAGQQFAAICVGALLASAAQAITEDNTGALVLSLPVLMLAANWSRFGRQGIYAATTAVFVLASGTAVSAAAVGHRVGQAALGAVVGVAVNALVLPPIHLRDVRENLAALAREAGDLLHSVADDLRETRWDAQSAADWSRQAAWLERRLDALYSARSWSRESLRMTSGPLRRLRRGPTVVPPEDEDRRWSRVCGNLTALTRTLAVAADEHRTPAPPDGPVLDLYARLLRLIGDACHAEAGRLVGERAGAGPEAATGATMEELHRRLQEGLREHAGQGAARTAVLGTLLLQAENLWAEVVPEPHTPDQAAEQ
ncbi:MULTISPECIES: FUSC family protein [Streptomyces]|uniref:Aromatic acid exporter family protein n=1 Tax=Streptomyces tendae TaxID=1932 RepID=A0ABW7RZX7_STRTE|nr:MULTISPECIES: FUSC family protein [unclassified Streptomyces]MBQ0963854.1 FUSC family protein [Streptomyces sp. RK74B]MBQ1004194.1 FUSC family protein [Streptomyces sp. RK23]